MSVMQSIPGGYKDVAADNGRSRSDHARVASPLVRQRQRRANGGSSATESRRRKGTLREAQEREKEQQESDPTWSAGSASGQGAKRRKNKRSINPGLSLFLPSSLLSSHSISLSPAGEDDVALLTALSRCTRADLGLPPALTIASPCLHCDFDGADSFWSSRKPAGF